MIYFIRHARSVMDRSTSADQWIVDAATAADIAPLRTDLAHVTVEHIMVSEEPKTHQTARLLFGADVILRPDRRLNELKRAGFIDDYEGQVAKIFSNPDTSVAGWESASSCLSRALGFLMDLPLQEDADHVILGHGLQGSLLRSRILGQHQVRLSDWRSVEMPDCMIFTTTPDGVGYDLLKDWGQSSR